MRKGWEKWCKIEERFLMDNYYNLTPKEAGLILGRSSRSVAHRAKFLGIKSRLAEARNTLNESFFETIDTPEKAYALGLIAADGNVGADGKIRIVLHSKDKEHLERVKSFFAPDYKLRKLNHANAVELSFNSQKMKSDLEAMGIYPAKTYSLEYPVNLPENMHAHFILGYFDGDGSFYLSAKTPCISFYGRESFLKSVAEIISIFTGVKVTKIRQVRKECLGFEMGYYGENAKEVYKWIGQSDLGMVRKSV